MKIFVHNLKQTCECGWSIFYRNWGGYHILHLLGIRITWGRIKKKNEPEEYTERPEWKWLKK